MRTVAATLLTLTAACAFPEQGDSQADGALAEGDGTGTAYDERDAWLDGCTFTQGYWKNHYDGAGSPGSNRDRPWPIDEDTELCGRSWLATFDVAPQGDAFFILAHQYLAASLNVAAGASAPADVSSALDEAEALLADCVVADGERARALELAALLDDFNNGVIGPGHCGDAPPADEPDCDGEVCQGGEEPPADDGCAGEVCDGSTGTDGDGDPELPPFG